MPEVRMIPVDKSGNLIARAYDLVHQTPGLRLGQTLWNIANEDYPEIMDHLCGTEYDFFYERHDATAINKFFTYFVGYAA